MLWVFVLLLICSAAANTEIVNFAVQGSQYNSDLPEFVSRWPVLDSINNEQRWNLTPAALYMPLEDVCEPILSSINPKANHPTNSFNDCPHELWIRLDLSHESWLRYSRFTLRLSWPASFPVEFGIQLYDSMMLSNLLSSSHSSASPPQHQLNPQRMRYARVRVVDTGVPVPWSGSEYQGLTWVPFNLILEPLYFGVLPASVVPLILLCIPIVVVGTLIASRLYDYFTTLAEQARLEVQQLNLAQRKDQ